jgi:hypothetical protein
MNFNLNITVCENGFYIVKSDNYGVAKQPSDCWMVETRHVAVDRLQAEIIFGEILDTAKRETELKASRR